MKLAWKHITRWIIMSLSDIHFSAAMQWKKPNFICWRSNNFDVALIRIPSVSFGETIRPVCLPTASQEYEQREVVVTGWGRQFSSGPSTDLLHKVGVRSLTNSQCTTGTLYQPDQITDNMICAAASGKVVFLYWGAASHHSIPTGLLPGRLRRSSDLPGGRGQILLPGGSCLLGCWLCSGHGSGGLQSGHGSLGLDQHCGNILGGKHLSSPLTTGN